MPGEFFGGTSGLKIDMPKRDFPPEYQGLSRLGYYSHQERSLEVNSSFYKLPQAKTVQRWVTEVPAGFRFTFKVWQEITHQKGLIFSAEAVSQFMKTIEIPEKSKGCLLVQFPPSLQVNAKEQLAELLAILNNYSWPVAVEFRHKSWYTDAVFELLNNYKAAMVIQDMPKAPSPVESTSDEFVYVRFHGPSGDYKGSYSESFLYEWALYIQEWQQEGKTVYAYFNNTAGDALANLHFLKRCLKLSDENS